MDDPGSQSKRKRPSYLADLMNSDDERDGETKSKKNKKKVISQVNSMAVVFLKAISEKIRKKSNAFLHFHTIIDFQDTKQYINLQLKMLFIVVF